MFDRLLAFLNFACGALGATWAEGSSPLALAADVLTWLAVPVASAFMVAAVVAFTRSRSARRRATASHVMAAQGMDRQPRREGLPAPRGAASFPAALGGGRNRSRYGDALPNRESGAPARAGAAVAEPLETLLEPGRRDLGVTAPTPPPSTASLAALAAALPRVGGAASPCLGDRHDEGGFRAAFDCIPHPMWVFDVEALRFLAVNDAAVYKYGYTQDEFLALTVWDVCPPEDVNRLVDSPEEGRPFPWRHRTKAGVLLDAEATAHRIRFGNRAAYLVFAGDGSDRRRTAAALREREELLRSIIAHIPCGVVWKDKASIYLGCNDQVARDFGLAVPGEVVGLTDYELVTVPEEAEISRACDRQVMESGEPLLNTEETRTKPGGEQITLLTSRVPLRDGTGKATGVLGVYLDISERKRLEEQYRQTAKMEAVGRLAGGIAHDFNNLLTVIRGNAELLLGMTEGLPEVSRVVDEVRLAADRAAGLIRQLLTFSRPHAVKPRVVDLNTVVNELAGILRRLIGAGVTMEVNLSPTPVPVLADRGHLEQVLMNLAVNAKDAMPDGGRLRIAVEWVFAPSSQTARLARLSVSDTGTGMTDEVKARIFDPFFTTKGPDKGTGLGLAVVHGIVKQAGGSVTVSSAPGAGTTFQIDLPLAESGPPPSAVHSFQSDLLRASAKERRTVLLVEDEDSIRSLARLTLEGCGFAVAEAPDGAAALEMLATDEEFDLLVTDMTMPGVGGREVAAKATAARPEVRVVYMSGYVPDDGRLREPPGAVFLPKPFTPADLVRAANQALGRGSASGKKLALSQSAEKND